MQSKRNEYGRVCRMCASTAKHIYEVYLYGCGRLRMKIKDSRFDFSLGPFIFSLNRWKYYKIQRWALGYGWVDLWTIPWLWSLLQGASIDEHIYSIFKWLWNDGRRRLEFFIVNLHNSNDCGKSLRLISIKGWVFAPFTKPYCRQDSQIIPENWIQLANCTRYTRFKRVDIKI